MKPLTARLNRFLRSPQMTFALGVLVCVCALSEIMEEVLESYEGVAKTVHGVLAFGIITVLKGLTELAEGIELVSIEMEEVEREDGAATERLPARETASQAPDHGFPARR